jgi:hypothetical protein
MTKYVNTRDLPACVRSVLERNGFRRDSIEVKASETFTVARFTVYEGNRSFTAIVALDGSNETVESQGSWGGANPFETRQVDVDDRKRDLPPGYVVVQGESGGRGAFATLIAHPSTFAPLLGAGDTVELTADEKAALLVIRSYTSAGRKEFFERHRWTTDRRENVLNALASKGFVERNKAGATKITTAGRNAVAGEHEPY